ncbi:MAG: CinA family protein [Pseudomonadota bacterium]
MHADLERDVLETCKAAGLMVATVESCTGGLVSGALTEIPGSSAVLERGFVTYSNEAKAELVGVPMALIDTHGAVSEEVAVAMAEGGLAHSRADLCVSITGVAGPGGSDFKPEGMVCFCAARRDGPRITETHQFGPLGRPNVRSESVRVALGLLIRRELH